MMNKRIQSINSTETYVQGTSKDLIYKIEDAKCDDIVKQW